MSILSRILAQATRPRSFAVFFGTLLAASCLLTPSLSQAVTVGPPKLELAVDPGATVSANIFLKNDGQVTQTFYPSVQKFTENSLGEKKWINDVSDIATWIHLPASVTLGADEQRDDIELTLIAPKDAAPGGHFAVVWWSTTPPNGSGEHVSIVTRAGILVYLRVAGNIVEKGHIGSFEANSHFQSGLPIDFNFDFTNDGNVALAPQGNIRITNVFGAVKAVVPVNPYGGSVLPASNKSFKVVWEGKAFFFGVYHAVLDVSYGESDVAASQGYWLVIVSPAGIAILVLLILFIFVLPPSIRRYNRWIIARAKQ